MSTFSGYKTKAFSESQKFFVLDPNTGTPSFVQGSDLVAQLTPNSKYVFSESTRTTAQATDYELGAVIQTGGATSIGDGQAGVYLVVAAGEGDFPMDNGLGLLTLAGDDTLFERLALNTVGDGSDLVAYTGTDETITEALVRHESEIDQNATDIANLPNSTATGELSKRLSLKRPITNYDYTRHKGFGVFDVFPSGRMIVMYRDAENHVGGDGDLTQITSDDNGLTWSVPTVIASTSGRDYRNINGGVDSSGAFHVIYENLLVAGGSNRTEVRTSTDEGETWGSPFVVSDTATATRVTPYGKLVETTSEIFAIARNTNSAEVRKITSTDGGATWSQVAILNPLEADEFTEISAVNCGSGRIVAVGRQSTVNNSSPWFTISSDDGATWSPIAEISNIAMGLNPPILWLDDSNDLVYLIHTSRGDDEMSSGGTGELRPFYFSSIGVDNLFGGTPYWREQVALPIWGPVQGGGVGDSGYQTLSKSQNGDVLMVFYSGNWLNGGTDLYISNMTAAAGIE